ncbi:EH domain-containing protein [Chloropicon primus]|uniref:EH domain-containing protein n=1 Tax=Chloropicon primus TaxID=1764295 RepID=A0A5B8MQG9_9CHLO|nr:hypothetical protein A3770_09p54660 [Chloropicon primus]UPR02172.1 EH domain-containing protein [Chloropicon primus]|eukprot:QDZ22948.1 hypothetical protein A3770_09p54660 [Chloropicon primus]
MSSNEDAVYEAWFAVAAEGGDKVLGNQAVQFFGRSELPKNQLAKVWSQADYDRSGSLSLKKFKHAMKLLALSQQGRDLSEAAVDDESCGMPAMVGLEEVTQKALGGDAGSNPFAEDGDDGADNPFGSPSSPATGTPVASQGRGVKVIQNAKEQAAMKKKKKQLSKAECTDIVDGLKHLYFSRIKKIEEEFKFGSFFSPCLSEGDFDSKPSVLLLGQYSTGKTTFIRHLLKSEYPGSHIGPEPTTDRFVVVHHGHEPRRTPGNTLAVQPDKPFQGLTVFGSAFLGRLEGAQCPNDLLENVTLIDTPGVLSGEKQRVERAYEFTSVCEWFASRSDLILLLFDPYKLDISDEFKNVIHSIKGHDDKVRIVLNKADQVDSQQLMRVYGALMWSLGKVFNTPEVVRVYIGSFNTEPISNEKNPLATALFEKEQGDLLKDLYQLPERSCDRKVNEFVKRIRALRMHVLIISHLRKQMPSLYGKKDKQQKLLNSLGEEFSKLQREKHLPPGDFPDPARYKSILSCFDLCKFNKIEKKHMKYLDDALAVDIPRLVKIFENPF